MGKKKHSVDPRPYNPSKSELKELKQRTVGITVRLDSLSIKELETLRVSEDKDRSEIIRLAVSEFAAKQLEKKITAELEAKNKVQSAQKSKGEVIEENFMKRLLFSETDRGWSQA